MYRTIHDFTEDWKRETLSTLRVFRVLNDASLGQKVTADGRSLGFLAWHIIHSLVETAEQTGLHVPGPAEDLPAPKSAREISFAYQAAADSIALQVREQWTDASLAEEVEVFGEKWKRGFALASLLRHQTHHRGQITVLMRQAGLRVPGVCGPAKEEWARLGMPAMP
jgi:uncharacterized damage-inducible protein DinB